MNVLWSSNAPWSTSGYGNQSALFLPRIRDLGHRVAASCFYGLEGSRLEWEGIPCYPTDNTRFGNLMLPEYARDHGEGDPQNCLVMTLMDVWVMLPAIQNLRSLRFACWTPVDHDPCPPLVTQFLEQSGAKPIAMSRFGERKLQDAGFDPLYVPHAVDTSVFFPNRANRDDIRDQLHLPRDAFVVGMVANNQGLPPRKSFPEVFDAFAAFQKKHSDALMYVHADVMGYNGGCNLIELAKRTPIPAEAMRTTDQLHIHTGLPQSSIANIYNSFDVLAHCSRGEGFGIAAIEAQACGIPIITTDCTAMSELVGPGWLVDGQRFYDSTQGAYWKTPNVSEIYEALEDAYDKADTLSLQAERFAADYDVNVVWEREWLSVLDVVTAPREIPALKVAA